MQTNLDDVYQNLAKLLSASMKASELDKAAIAKFEQEAAMILMKLMT